VLYMSMSLDGYIAGPNDEPGHGFGDDGDRLHNWFVTPDGEFFRPSGPAGQLIDEWNATGAVLVGRRTAEFVDHWGGDHHGVPIFVPSHRPPGPSAANYPLVTYVTDGIASAMARRGPTELSTGSAMDAVVDVCGLRRVDHPNDLQLDT
jgi:dihydrofolate reductase